VHNQSSSSSTEIYDRIGSTGFQRLIDSFYSRVEKDDILRPMYPDEDLAPAARRLRLFLEQYFGGPQVYSQERGHPRLRMRHMPFKIDEKARDRWVQLMLEALQVCDFDEDVEHILRDYFERGATFLMNHHPTVGGMFTVPHQS
jgi:hemoglobin